MAKNEIRFTDAKLRALLHPVEGREEYWDTTCRGLKLRVGKRAKVFYAWGRVKTLGSRALPFHHKIGEFPAIGIADAHEKAFQVFRDASKGTHPAKKLAADLEKLAEEDRAKHKAEIKRDREKFSNVAALYIEDYAKPRKRSWGEDERILQRDLVPAWGNRTLDDIEPIEVTELLRKVAKRAAKSKQSATKRGAPMANRTLACLRKLYNWAIANGYATRSPINNGMARSEKDASRKRIFEDAEIRAIWKASGALPAHALPAVRMLIASGQRLSVVSGMKHSELDRENSIWTIPGDEVGRSKSKLEHKVPLTDLMLELIDSVPQVEGVDHVFCSHHRGDKPLTLGNKLKRTLDDECGFNDWTFQGLRGLVVTRMRREPLRIDRDIINLIEGRRPSDVQSQHYDSHDYLDEKREGLERWNNHLRRILDDDGDKATDDNVKYIDRKTLA